MSATKDFPPTTPVPVLRPQRCMPSTNNTLSPRRPTPDHHGPRHELRGSGGAVEVSTEELLEHFGEVASLLDASCKWVELRSVELVIGYLSVHNGICTIYIGRTETSVWLPDCTGAAHQHTGPLAEMIRIVSRAIAPARPPG